MLLPFFLRRYTLINLFQPNINITDAVSRYKSTLESGWLGRGQVTSEFEKVLSEFLGTEAEHVHCVSSCTSAIFEICSALGLGVGDTVVIPTNSFPSVPAAIMSTGAQIAILDLDADTGNISLDQLVKYCDENNPTAVFATDYGGLPVSVSKLKAIVGEDCYILVDAAASLGTRYKDNREYIHSLADFVCYSFDAMKLVTCGEGGAAVIKDKHLREKFKEFSYLGLPAKQKSGLDVAKDGRKAGWWEYELTCLGRRSVMSDLAAGLGLSQMSSIESKLQCRRDLKVEYERLLGSFEPITLLSPTDMNLDVSNYFCTILVEDRDGLAAYLLENGVYTSFRYWPIHKMEIFSSGLVQKNYFVGDDMANSALNLPIHDALDLEDIRHISDLVIGYLVKSKL